MPGKIDFFIGAVSFISAIAAITDVWRNKIYNWLTLPAIVGGLVFSAVQGGWTGAGDALLGVLAGFLLYGWMYLIRVMGAGDVKLLMALGAWGGLSYAAEVALLGVFVGGAMSFLILLFSGRIGGFSRKMYRFLVSLFVKELELETPAIDRKLKMPFGLPIAVAAIWTALSHPLQRWGLTLW